MIRAVFHHTRSLCGVDRYFDSFVKTPLDATLPTISMTTSTILSGISSFFFGPRSQTNFISDSPAANQFCYFRFAVMKSEARKFEEESGLEINKELMKNPSLDIQVVFQLACKKLGVLPSPLLHYHHLSIYRQAAFILDIPQHHFLFPLLWNDFLTSYMHRLPNKDGIGHRYFTLPEDISLLKKLKKCSSDVQLNLSGKADEKPLLAMYRAITLWLDEPRLHDRSLSFSSLPSQYQPNVLNAIINKHNVPFTFLNSLLDFYSDLCKPDEQPFWEMTAGRFVQTCQVSKEGDIYADEEGSRKREAGADGRLHPKTENESCAFIKLGPPSTDKTFNYIGGLEAWIAFVGNAGMSDVISTQIKRWFLDSIEGKVSSNVKHLNNLRTSMAIKSSSERLNAHLLQNVSSKPQPAPLPLLLYPHSHNFREEFILDHQSSFVRRSSLNKRLNDEIVRLLRVLHLNVSTESVVTLRCKSYVSPLHRCKGPAVLTLRHQQKCVDEIVSRNLTEQENKLMRLTTESSTPPHQSVFLSFSRLENIIDALVKCQGLMSHEMRSKHEYAQVATFLFYKILSNMTESNNNCPITTESFSSYVDILGKAFIVNNPSQPSVLLLAIQHNPNFNSMLTPFFNPQSNLNDFVQLYAQVLQMLPSKASGASSGGDDDDDSDEYVSILLGNNVGNDSRIILPEDVVLCLLTKFDITSWLMHARTTYADHVELLNHIINALMITKHSTRMQVVFKQHLLVLCKHRPPGHLVFHLIDALLKVGIYFIGREIITVSLLGTESGRLNADVWEIMLNVIGCTWTNAFDDEQNFSFSFDENVINLFGEEEVLKIIQIMGCYFHGRLQHKSNNSSKRSSKWFNIRYRKYVKQFGKVLFCVSLLIIQHTYNSTMRSSSYDPITNISTSVDMLFDKIQYIYDPWISWKNNLKQCWLENCNLLTTNMHLVSTMMLSWVKSLEAVQTYFGGKIHQPCQLLNRLWHFYVVQSDVQAMPNFLSDVLHNHLYLLPWRFYLPTATDYSKPCFEMVGHVFTSVNWLEAVDRLRRPNNYNERFSAGSDDRNNDEYENDCVVHRLIFVLLVRMAAEETIIKNSQLSSLILSKNLFDWKQKLDSSTFQQAAQSYVDRCNYINKIFSLDLTDCHTCVLSLLKEAACFNCREIAPTAEMLADEQYHLYPTLSSNRSKEEADVNDKRVSYVRFVVQLIIKSSDASNLEHNGIILNNLLSEVEFVVKKCSVSAAPMCLECWSLLNSCNSIAAEHFLTVM
ncbi:hypothetical protein HELRODRAFT_192632 [Helobdella robusta]|uniref:Ectopic P granules protein 5 homolog n=1 Tax=Helobdella robusta TaxID=6412 RepID=T1FU53_HELRO|nr:hypothetical protein HELRODRAFT_192632 [Helobdella robusta]ESO00219.1 hypothetical protein HELRODRAFT_192632 [Helobdella robusta]